MGNKPVQNGKSGDGPSGTGASLEPSNPEPSQNRLSLSPALRRSLRLAVGEGNPVAGDLGRVVVPDPLGVSAGYLLELEDPVEGVVGDYLPSLVPGSELGTWSESHCHVLCHHTYMVSNLRVQVNTFLRNRKPSNPEPSTRPA